MGEGRYCWEKQISAAMVKEDINHSISVLTQVTPYGGTAESP